MEVVNPLVAHLSAFEVLQLLIERKTHYSAQLSLLEASAGPVYQSDRDHVFPPNISTLTFEGIKHLSADYSATGRVTEEGMRRLLEGLEGYCVRGGRENGLTKAERLQICDLAPTQPVEFHLIVEECDLRFTDEEVDAITSLVASTLTERKTPLVNGINGISDGVKEEDAILDDATDGLRPLFREEEDDADDALVAEGLGGDGGEERELDEVPD